MIQLGRHGAPQRLLDYLDQLGIGLRPALRCVAAEQVRAGDDVRPLRLEGDLASASDAHDPRLSGAGARDTREAKPSDNMRSAPLGNDDGHIGRSGRVAGDCWRHVDRRSPGYELGRWRDLNIQKAPRRCRER